MSADLELFDALRLRKPSSVPQLISSSQSRGSFFIPSSILRSTSSFDGLSPPRRTNVPSAIRRSSSLSQYSVPAETLPSCAPRGLVPTLSTVCAPVTWTSQRSCGPLATAAPGALAGLAAAGAFDPLLPFDDLPHAARVS